ncbi:recombination-associated protein RdgC [Desulfurispira natronophila]|uniref:DNA recombination-dependent growth factor C n=1 Tax=Desulfurispira natronophila TaxID=682562 RepID=A0A7W8DGB3_9BACT|nr:recombination-associated protein RdgC [Desulfurispira natronophila]MBB5021227.1 DNA recombination-dependent growth factor C [Desulfurispira natronophila]
MAFYTGSISYTPYMVQGEAGIDYMDELSECLIKHRFVSFDEVEFSESTMGWVSPKNFLHNHFTTDDVFPSREHMLVSLRLDKKVVPSPMLKAMLPEREHQYRLDAGKERLSRDDRLFVKEQTRQHLLRQQYPQTKVWDVLYDIPAGRIYFGSTSQSANDLFVEYFRKSFDRKIFLMSPQWRMENMELSSAMAWAREQLAPENFGGDHE